MFTILPPPTAWVSRLMGFPAPHGTSANRTSPCLYTLNPTIFNFINTMGNIAVYCYTVSLRTLYMLTCSICFHIVLFDSQIYSINIAA